MQISDSTSKQVITFQQWQQVLFYVTSIRFAGWHDNGG
jgi:hypothetical protein